MQIQYAKKFFLLSCGVAACFLAGCGTKQELAYLSETNIAPIMVPSDLSSHEIKSEYVAPVVNEKEILPPQPNLLPHS
jgi:hypothetical protein